MEPDRTLPGELATEAADPAPEELSASPRMLGRYTVLEALGRGAMGSVYAAYDPQLDRRVAVKLLHQRDEHANAALMAEAKSLARLAHPNVLTVHDVGTDADRVFVAMAFVDGPTLGGWLESLPRPLSASDRTRVLHVMVGAGQGLAAAHDAGLVHRDFKPHNVLMSDEDRPLVADFGLAQPIEADSTTSQVGEAFRVAGTPAYLAPEIFEGAPADERSDQFSFCVALFEALYGQRPFRGDTLPALAYAISQGDVVDVPTGDAPRWLHQHVLRGLAVEPEARWPNMRALVSALERDPSQRWRRWSVGAAVGLGLVGLGTALGSNDADPCTAGPERIAQTWGPSRSQTLRAAFSATGSVLAEETAERVTARLDARASQWAEAYGDACRQHRTGAQSDDMHDRRMVCLARTRVQIDALVTALEGVEEGALRRAVDAVDQLPSVGRCGDLVALASDVPAAPPQHEARIAEIERAAAELRSAFSLDKVEDGAARAESLVEQAEALGYPVLTASVYAELGLAARRSGDVNRSVEAYERAWHLALQTRQDDLAASTLLALTKVYGFDLSDAELALSRSRDAESMLVRVAERDADEARIQRGRLAHARSIVELRRPDFEAAEAHIAEAETILVPILPPDHIHLVNLYNTKGMVLANVDATRAAEAYLTALDIQPRRIGEFHPGVIMLRNNLGVPYRNAGDPALAVEQHQEAYDRLRSHGEARQATMVGLNLGASLVAAQRWEAAIEVLEPILSVDSEVRTVPPDRHHDFAVALNHVGRLDDAVEQQVRRLDAALQLGDVTRASRAARDLVSFALGSERTLDDLSGLERAVARIEPGTPEAAASRLRASLARALWQWGDDAERPRAQTLARGVRAELDSLSARDQRQLRRLLEPFSPGVAEGSRVP